jgi:hypothetical protein
LILAGFAQMTPGRRRSIRSTKVWAVPPMS